MKVGFFPEIGPASLCHTASDSASSDYQISGDHGAGRTTLDGRNPKARKGTSYGWVPAGAEAGTSSLHWARITTIQGTFRLRSSVKLCAPHWKNACPASWHSRTPGPTKPNLHPCELIFAAGSFAETGGPRSASPTPGRFFLPPLTRQPAFDQQPWVPRSPSPMAMVITVPGTGGVASVLITARCPYSANWGAGWHTCC